MNAVALGLVLGGAALHATWNILLKTAVDPFRLAARGMAVAAVGGTPAAAAVWLAAGRPGLAWGAAMLAAASAAVEAVYFGLLSAAYRRGDLSSVYPIARGTAPLLAAGAGVVILGERLTALEAAGVAVLVLGIWLVRRPSARLASGLAVLTGVAIAAYSSIDAVAVRMAPPWLYAWILWVLTAALLMAVSAARRAPAALPRGPEPEGGPTWRAAAAAGALMTGAYLPILFAFSLAPLAIVAPMRESGIVIAAGWGVVRLREREGGRVRLAGAIAVLLGVLLLASR